MSLGYRTVLTTDSTPENLERILEVLRAWFVGRKGFDSLPVNGTEFNQAGSQLKTSRFESGDTSAYRWELVEDWDAPRWYKNTE